MQPVLLKMKLRMPPLLPGVVPRPRLLLSLEEGLERKATFITAPAGYGKSTLVSAWIGQRAMPAAWLSLDTGDNDMIRFWHYIISSIDCAHQGFADKVNPALESLTPGAFETFLVPLLGELGELPNPLVLVLDDLHVIHDKRVVASVAFFLDYLPAQVHLYITSREEAAFATTRLFSSGWAAKLDVGDLRFDVREAAELFRLWKDASYTQEQIELLVQRTEGWVTGLKLAALSLRKAEQLAVIIQDVAGDSGWIAQYLLEEVYHSLEPAVQDFLAKCSVLQRFSGPLCEAVSGETDCRQLLLQLTDAGLFIIPLDYQKNWFRFHHLFADFLKSRLTRSFPGEVPGLYKTAGDWCAARGMLEDAVEYYLAGKHFTEATQLLERRKTFAMKREYSTLRHWLSAIPEPILWEHRFLYFSYILSLLWNHEPQLAEVYLQQAEQRYHLSSADWSQEEKDRFLGNLYYLRNTKATQYDMDVVQGLEYIQLSLQHSPVGTDLLFAPPHMPLSPSIFRSYNGKRGQHLSRGMADTFFQRMIEFLTPMRVHDSTIVCYGELLYERGDLEEAEAVFRQGLQENVHNPYQPEKVYVTAYLFLSRIARARGNNLEAKRWLEEAQQRAVSDRVAAVFLFIEAELAALALDQGDVAPALEWRDKYKVNEGDPVSLPQLYIYTFLARVLLQEGRCEEAEALADRLFLLAVQGHRPMDALELGVLQALIHRHAGKTEQAVLTLEQALRYAESDGYTRVFADRGMPAAELLMTYIEMRRKGHIRESETPSLAFVRHVLSCFSGTEWTGQSGSRADRTARLEQLLTKRELTIFRCLAGGMTNKQMAETLNIGMGTLKSHINHIYGKLQARNRVEAIRRGNDMME